MLTCRTARYPAALAACLLAGAAAPDLAPNGVHKHGTPHVHHGYVPPPLPPHAGALPARKTWKLYSGTPTDVLTYHYDALRTGWNPSETDLTPASVASTKFQQLMTLNVDGNVLAEPLLVANYGFPDGSTHDVLIVATGHDTVYAYDANSYALLWQVSLGTSQSSGDVGCGDVQPEYGINSTPVIVRNGGTATIYVVAAIEPASMSFHHMLHALDLGTGQDLITPVEIAPVAHTKSGTITFQPQNQWNRAGLAYNNGMLYLGIGSHCDQTSASGWMLRYNTNLQLQTAFHTEAVTNEDLGSIWMTGFAPSISPTTGNVFAVTGNGNYSRTAGSRGLAMTALGFTPTLSAVATTFTPADWQNLSNNDEDFASGGIMLLPSVGGSAPPLAAAIGKWGTLYLLNQTRLGGLTTNDKGAVAQVSGVGGVWGGPSFYSGPNGPTILIQGDGSVLNAFAVSNGTRPTLKQVAQGTSSAGYGGALMAVSSNGSAANTGVVWLARRSTDVQLEAYDAVALGNPLVQLPAGTWSNPGQANPFVTPMEANGRVYVPAYKTVTVFGLVN